MHIQGKLTIRLKNPEHLPPSCNSILISLKSHKVPFSALHSCTGISAKNEYLSSY